MFRLVTLTALLAFSLAACSTARNQSANVPTATPTPNAISTQTPEDKLPEADLDVNGIRSGTSYSEIIKRIGKPDRVRDFGKDECTDGMMRTLYYPGLKIDLESDEKKQNYTVVAFEVTSETWILGGTIRLGASPEAVKGRYGIPLKNSTNEHVGYVSKDNLGGVDFTFKDRKLVKAVLHETLC